MRVMLDSNVLISALVFDSEHINKAVDGANFDIRDTKDRPVVLSALAGKADVLLTGDKDFADVEVPGLRVAHPVQFAAELGLVE